MSRRNEIVVSANPHEQGFVEGIIGAGLTPYPGTAMQIDHTVALVGGRHTWVLYNRDADGNMPDGPIIILREDHMQGKTMNDAYAAGNRAFGYIPEAGDELNLRMADISGTGTVSAGAILIIDDATGEFIVSVGSPEDEVAKLLEDVLDVAAAGDQLAWAIWSR